MAMNSPENAPRTPFGSMFAMKHEVANLQMFVTVTVVDCHSNAQRGIRAGSPAAQPRRRRM